MDVVGSQIDFSQDPKFAEAVTKKVYYGPVYFRRESEPYMTLALAGTRRDAGVRPDDAASGTFRRVSNGVVCDILTQRVTRGTGR